MLAAFDGADASAPCSRRERSNTPLQALALLNDPVFVECARALGLRVVRECPGGRDSRIAHAFRLCLARAPTAEETRVLGQVHDEHRALYAADATAAALSTGGRRRLPSPDRRAGRGGRVGGGCADASESRRVHHP